MAKPRPEDVTVPAWKYSCTGCGACCTQRWHVYVDKAEQERLSQLAWTPEDGIPRKLYTRIGGNDYIDRRANGSCIFLEEATNLCKIHAKHGYEAKPIGCRAYPYTITTTFPGKFSVTCRMDCPAVRANDGKRIADDMPAIRGFIDEMGIKGGFDAEVLDGLTEETARKISRALFEYIIDFKEAEQAPRIAMALMAIDRMETMGSSFLNGNDLQAIWPSFFKRIKLDMAHQPLRRLGRTEQWRFLALLSAYLRRDEEIVGRGGLARIRRSIEMTRLYFGSANLHTLGKEHPDMRIHRSQLFATTVANARDVDWSLWMEIFRIRLQAYQFMGPANYGLSFFSGLKSLLVTFPLVMATAKAAAIARDPETIFIRPEDVDYAVGAIDHSYGRSAYLSFGMFATLTSQMTEPPNYFLLLHNLLG